MWRTVKSFANTNSPLTTNVCNDPTSEIFVELQEELIKSDIQPIELLNRTDINETDPLNCIFTNEEFRSALSLCKKDTVPGLDDITYFTIKKLS